MTRRKPPEQTWESFVEEQIREAQAAGEFDHLPGFGKPIPELDGPEDELWWIKQLLKRERLSLLPPALEIRRVAERRLAEIMQLASESAVRRAVEALNRQILQAQFAITWGPPSTLLPLDVEEVVRQWRKQEKA